MVRKRERRGPGLETIRRSGRGSRTGAPVLLVHGAWHGAWCWDEGFMDALAAQGHDTVAVSLRGHGGSEGRGPLERRRHAVADYVADVSEVADALDAAPIVVGHSLGGFVVQRYLAEGRRARAGVLLAPLPATGVAPLLLRLARRHPAAVAKVFATLSCRPVVEDPARAARLLFSEGADAGTVARATARLGDESFRVFVELLRPRLRTDRVTVPVSVFAAGADAVFTAAETAATAAAYGVRAVTIPGMGHDMMLEPGWAELARRVGEWCASVDGSAPSSTADAAATRVAA